jgi:hypothetical protein
VERRGTKAASPVMRRRERKGELSFIRPPSQPVALHAWDVYHIGLKFATMSERVQEGAVPRPPRGEEWRRRGGGGQRVPVRSRFAARERKRGAVMTKGKRGGMKSALELAMERLDEKGVSPSSLTGKQKEELAVVERELQARIAELEILSKQRLSEAHVRGDDEKVQLIEEGTVDEIARLRRQAESRKEKIRKG